MKVFYFKNLPLLLAANTIDFANEERPQYM